MPYSTSPGYIGPDELWRRFMAGFTVTYLNALEDGSQCHSWLHPFRVDHRVQAVDVIAGHDRISPYSWQEILDKFPLDYSNWVPIAEHQIPPGRIVRELDDKAGQYGDLLEHGDTIVCKPGNVFFCSASATSATTTYTMAGMTAGSSSVTFTAVSTSSANQ